MTAYNFTGTAREVRAYIKRCFIYRDAIIDELIEHGYIEHDGTIYRFYELDDDGDDYGVDVWEYRRAPFQYENAYME